MEFIAWITAHADELSAVIGAAYVLARLIVALTPTDADEKALERAGVALSAIAVVFGLDIKQGIKKATKQAPPNAAQEKDK